MNRVDVEAALRAIVELAGRRPAFTTDDVWEGLPNAEDGRAIANAFLRAEQRGVIRNSRIGAYRRGHQAHRRWLSVWLSNAIPSSLDDAAAYAAAPETSLTPPRLGAIDTEPLAPVNRDAIPSAP